MAECECLRTCPFFQDKMPDMPVTAHMVKQRYCLQGYPACARFIVYKRFGSEGVPEDLYPDQIEWARSIVDRAR